MSYFTVRRPRIPIYGFYVKPVSSVIHLNNGFPTEGTYVICIRCSHYLNPLTAAMITRTTRQNAIIQIGSILIHLPHLASQLTTPLFSLADPAFYENYTFYELNGNAFHLTGFIFLNYVRMNLHKLTERIN